MSGEVVSLDAAREREELVEVAAETLAEEAGWPGLVSRAVAGVVVDRILAHQRKGEIL